MSLFRDAYDYQVFLKTLRRAAERRAVSIHGFVLMGTHVHLVATPAQADSLPEMMRTLGVKYARHFNRKYDRLGTLWAERYGAFPLDTDAYLLNCVRYVEQNPVRATMVSEPELYQWSSYGAHANGQWPDWLTPHPVYLALGSTAEERQARYRVLCGQPIADDDLMLPRAS